MNLYHYSQLNTSEKKMYDAIYNAALNFERSVTFPVLFGASSKGLQNVINALQQDHVELFYFDFSVSITGGLGETTAHLKYLYKKEVAKRLNSQMRIVLERILAKARTIKGEYEKVLFIHDILTENVIYDLDAPNAHNSLGTLLEGKAVCQGIAYATKMVFDELEIECVVATGEVNTSNNRGAHSWNLIRVNNRWYHLDVTLDLKQNGAIFHTYFLINDDDAFLDHYYGEKINIECKFINDNYFYRNKSFFTTFDDAAKYIIDELKKNKRAEVKMLKVGKDDVSPKIMRAISKRTFFPINYFISSNVDLQVYTVFTK